MGRTLLSVNDSAWLFAETRRTPMQVGMLATFRVPEGEPTFVADLVARWREARHFHPPYNYLFHRFPVPSWSELEDDQIDLDYHLRHSALPSPGSQRELGVLVSRLHSSRMDRRYPLWECHVIEGLEEDRWSLYFKAHHSQVDGVGGVRLLRRMLSVDPERRGMLPPWAVGAHGPDQSGLPPREKPTREVERAADVADRDSLLGDLATGVTDRVRAGAAVGGSLAQTYVETLTGLRRDPDRAVPFRAPRSILNERIHAPRRFATQHYSVDRLKAVATAADASLNDVYLALCGGALRRYLLELDALPTDDLTANVPVSVRPEGGARVGNAITFLYASLGTTVEDPLQRVALIKASTRLGKARLPDVGGAAMDAYTAALMAPFLSVALLGVGGHGRPAANVVVSNVPGPAETRYLDGSPVEEIYPVSLLFNGQALNITGVSYDGSFNIGFTGCRDSVPSLQRIAVYSGEELERLEQALGL
ncbi:WS/DGAT/MGAT family O-acyltransferase [Nocardioides sp. AX2bis]|uniref:WS/DGAT/MGAT family O-acyltransferase n=1 Tax=Nocardioides sp. AX2bis TaxID=2653157 RepID=UPI0012F27184|nr:wax ester/triacylglycerol synthase family O-acyltransferase [Nocardioides sp. AX2bis]VXC06190.1 Diacylglycerol O-acyltransferase [Nocardioides sp. AX2bis]